MKPSTVLFRNATRMVVFVLVLLSGAWPASASEAEPVLDVSQPNGGASAWMDYRTSLAQTFQPHISGQLMKVQTTMAFQNVIAYPVIFSVVETDAGVPSGRVLGRTVFTNYLNQNWNTYEIQFASASIFLRSNEVYALVLNSDAPAGFSTMLASAWTGDPYPPGKLWQKYDTNEWKWIAYFEGPPTPDSDLTFATYMVAGLPPIRITSPLQDSRFRADETVSISAEAAAGGPEQRVYFYQNGALLGLDSESPYLFRWDNVPGGTYELTAVLNDAVGMTATSAVVRVNVAANTPGNDDFANRWGLSGPYVSGAGSNREATSEAGEPVHASGALGATIWWTWLSTNSGPVFLTTAKSAGTNIALAVYRGSAVDNLSLISAGPRELVFNAVPGVSYEIAVDTLGTNLESIELRLAASDFAIVSPPGRSVFTAPATITATASGGFGTRTIERVDFYEDNLLVGSSASPPYSLIYTNKTPGTHLLSARAIDAQGMASFAPAVSFTVRPQNDNFASALPLEGYEVTEEATTVAATMEPREFRWASNRGGHSIWYTWTAPESGICTLSGTGSGNGLLFGMFFGSAVDRLTIVGDNAYSSQGAPVSFPVYGGTTYRLSVDGFEGEQGNVSFSLRLTPANDRFNDGKFILGASYSEVTSIRGATREFGEPMHSGYPDGHSLWWSWTAPASGLTTFSCTSMNPPVTVAAYEGRTLENMSLVTNSIGTNAGATAVSFTARKGVTYAFAVDELLPGGGDLEVDLTMFLVRLTSPLPGAVFKDPADVQLSAVQPESLDLSRVDFLVNEGLIASLSGPPFTHIWSNAPSGSYTVVARGVTAKGDVYTSLPLDFLVYTNNEMPVPKISAGWISSYAISAAGNLYVWGWNGLHHFGLTTEPLEPICDPICDPPCCEPALGEPIWFPTMAHYPAGVTQWKEIAASLGVTFDNPLSWALGNNGQLYRQGRELLPMPEGISQWISIQNGFAVGNNGRYYYNGTLGQPQSTVEWATVFGDMHLSKAGELYIRGATEFTLVPFPAGVTNWKAVVIGMAHRLALAGNGDLYAWGFNYSGQLGVGDKTDRSVPTRVQPPTGVTKWTTIAAGGHHSLAIADDGALYAWGRNWENQLGVGYPSDQPGNAGGTNATIIETAVRPLKVPFPVGVNGWSAVAAGFSHSLAIGNDCQLYSFGENSFGQLGTGSVYSFPYPRRVLGLGPLCGTPVINSDARNSRLPDGSFQIEFRSDLNRLYYVQYSSDAVHWKSAVPALLGTGEIIVWVDDGPPKTDSLPGNETTRFYRVISGD